VVSLNEDEKVKWERGNEGALRFAAKVLAMEHGPGKNTAGQKSWAEMNFSAQAATIRRHSARIHIFQQHHDDGGLTGKAKTNRNSKTRGGR